VRTASSSEQHGAGVLETLQGEVPVLLNVSAEITYYGAAIGGAFLYEGWEEVTIGSQTWMKRNWDNAYPGSRVYNDDEDNRAIYGGLYSWNQIMSVDFCPEGWHVPTEAEINILLTFLGGQMIAGGHLKEVGDDHWNDPNTGADDNYGFRALPGGIYDTIYELLGANGLFWLKDENTFNNWYLPSKDELALMYSVLYLNGLGNFSQNTYWTSSESVAISAWYQNFGSGAQSVQTKSYQFYVRAIHSFTSIFSYDLQDVGPAGGYIFYKNGNQYLECAPSDQSVSSAWSNITNVAIGTTGTAVGTGSANTTAIIGQAGETSSAARICVNLII
jgi:uncharacterized protein (TIGR02145 family)